jgi:hypothetical protein
VNPTKWEQCGTKKVEENAHNNKNRKSVHRRGQRRPYRLKRKEAKKQRQRHNPHKWTRKPVQGKYACKKRKYETEDPDITLTWDDAELVMDKVQDRSEEVVRTTEAQREQIMAKLLEVHANIQHLWNRAESQATARPQEETQRPPAQREGEETMQFIIQGRETFTIMRQMINFDQEMMQKPLEEVEQVELVMAQIPTKALYGLQASVMQEVHSRACADATNIEVGRGVTEMLQITCDQLTVEKEEEKEHRQARAGIDNDIQLNPQQRAGNREKRRGEDQPHRADN